MSNSQDDVGVVGFDLLFCKKGEWTTQYYTSIYDEPAFPGEWTDFAKCDEDTYMYGAIDKTAYTGPQAIIDDTGLEGLKIICRDICIDDFALPEDGDYENHADSNVHLVGEVTDGNGEWRTPVVSHNRFIGGANGVGTVPLGIYDDRGLNCIAFTLVETCC